MYKKLGTEIGEQVNLKQKAYGNSMFVATEIMHTFLLPYQNEDRSYTIPFELVDHIVRQVRIIDKQSRIMSNPKHDLMDESPYRDIAGYGILGEAVYGKGKTNE